MTTHTGAGGAATHAGIDFQQRVAAWFATAMLAHMDVSCALSVANPLYVERISMETADSVDDFVLSCEGGRKVFIQAKTSPALSSDPDSDFGEAVGQFVGQYRAAPKSSDLYILAVAPTASGKIRQQLRKLLLAVRYDRTAWNTVTLSELEKEVLNTFSLLVRQFSKETEGSEWTEEILIEFAQRVYIATFDMDDSGSDCRSAYILLQALTRLKSPADLVWSRLIQLCLDASKKRLQISKEGLRTSLSRFMEDAEKEISTKAFFEIIETGTVSTGKEVVLMENSEFGNDLFLFEMRRFDEQGQQRIKFTNGKCVLRSGEYHLLRRTATIAGMERFLLRNPQVYTGRKLVIVPAKLDEDPDLGGAAKARTEWIKKKLERVGHELKCLYCGRGVSASAAAVVEVDDYDHAPDAGVVHEPCIQPMHRIIGEIRSKFFEDNPHVVDFDVNLWVEKLRRGQAVLAGLRNVGNPPGATIAWDPEPIELNLRYCIRFQLANGSRPPALRRGKVQRFSLEEAKKNLAEAIRQIDKGLHIGDPLCMSDDGLVFGHRSLLPQSFSEETVSECISAQIEPYSRDLGENYDQNASYYAPLIAVRVGDSEKYLRIGQDCVLLSDLTRVEEHFANWAMAGIFVSDYYLEIIPDDAAFDSFMRNNVAAGCGAIINPMLAANGTATSGIHVFPLVNPIDGK